MQTSQPKTDILAQNTLVKKPMKESIAKLEIIGVDSDGTKFNIIAKVGKPYAVDGKYE